MKRASLNEKRRRLIKRLRELNKKKGRLDALNANIRSKRLSEKPCLLCDPCDSHRHTIYAHIRDRKSVV